MGYGFYAYFTPDATRDTSFGPILDQQPQLSAMDSQGNRYLRNKGLGDFYSMCPSNPESHRSLARLMTEAIAKYPVDGLHLDRIRYPSADFCYCDFCRKKFRRDMRIDLEEFQPRSEQAKLFTEWKRQQTLNAVQTFVRAVRRARLELPITSYVLSPAEMNSKAQGWDLWMRDRLLNAVAVSMYEKDIRPVIDDALPLLNGDSSRLICAISAEKENGGDAYLRNINTARSFHALGQITWYSDEALDEVNGLRRGPYHEPAQAPFSR
jgi:hypothetical protein